MRPPKGFTSSHSFRLTFALSLFSLALPFVLLLQQSVHTRVQALLVNPTVLAAYLSSRRMYDPTDRPLRR